MSLDNLKLVQSCISLLDEALSQFTEKMPRAKVVRDSTFDGYRYESPDEELFIVLRCVRIVSGFRAALCLINEGFNQEAGAILRSVLEFSHDLQFFFATVVDPSNKALFSRKLAEYFQDISTDTQQILAQTKKPASVPRKKIYAATGRLLDQKNPHSWRQITKSLEDAYSGYVHGNYIQTMELYNGNDNTFRTNGYLEAKQEWLSNMALIVHPVLNHFAHISTLLELKDMRDRLLSQRKILEKSEIYNQP